MLKGGWVYILTNKPHGVLYTGVTAHLDERLYQHRQGVGSSFARRYNCDLLVFAEKHGDIVEAIYREKCIKKWSRLWQLKLIQAQNATWCDLSSDLHTI